MLMALFIPIAIGSFSGMELQWKKSCILLIW